MATPQGRRGAQQKKVTAAAEAAKPEPRRIGLRMARGSDATPLYNMLMGYFAEFMAFYPPPEEMPTIAWGLTVIQTGAVVLAVEQTDDGEKLIGCMGLERGAHPWAPRAQYFNTVWFYVIPERRTGGTANHLVKAAKDIAEANQIPLRMDYVWGLEPSKQDRYREIMGFTYAGGNYLWVPPAKAASQG